MNCQKGYRKRKVINDLNHIQICLLFSVFLFGILFSPVRIFGQTTIDSLSDKNYVIIFHEEPSTGDGWEVVAHNGEAYRINYNPIVNNSNLGSEKLVRFFPEVTYLSKDTFFKRGFDPSQIAFYFYDIGGDCWKSCEYDSYIHGDTMEILSVRKKTASVLYDTYKFCEGVSRILTPVFDDYLTDIQFSAADELNIDQIRGTITFENPQTGKYAIKYKSLFCLSKYEDTIDINPLPAISIEKQRNICEGRTIELSPEFPDEYSYQWSNNAVTHNTFVSQPGDYIVSATNEFGCVKTDTVKVELKQIEFENFDYKVADADCYQNGSIEIRLMNVKNGSGPYRYQFRNKVTNIVSNSTDTLREGDYILTIEDTEGCKTDYMQQIKIRKDCLNDYPVFSPNTDGMDDDYYISAEGEAIVYDRNGIEVRRFLAPVYWDGKNESGQPLPMGNYLIVIGKEVVNITIIK